MFRLALADLFDKVGHEFDAPVPDRRVPAVYVKLGESAALLLMRTEVMG